MSEETAALVGSCSLICLGQGYDQTILGGLGAPEARTDSFLDSTSTHVAIPIAFSCFEIMRTPFSRCHISDLLNPSDLHVDAEPFY